MCSEAGSLWDPLTSRTELVLKDISIAPACVPAASRGWCPTGHHPTDAERSMNASGILMWLLRQFCQLEVICSMFPEVGLFQPDALPCQPERTGFCIRMVDGHAQLS